MKIVKCEAQARIFGAERTVTLDQQGVHICPATIVDLDRIVRAIEDQEHPLVVVRADDHTGPAGDTWTARLTDAEVQEAARTTVGLNHLAGTEGLPSPVQFIGVDPAVKPSETAVVVVSPEGVVSQAGSPNDQPAVPAAEPAPAPKQRRRRAAQAPESDAVADAWKAGLLAKPGPLTDPVAQPPLVEQPEPAPALPSAGDLLANMPSAQPPSRVLPEPAPLPVPSGNSLLDQMVAEVMAAEQRQQRGAVVSVPITTTDDKLQQARQALQAAEQAVGMVGAASAPALAPTQPETPRVTDELVATLQRDGTRLVEVVLALQRAGFLEEQLLLDTIERLRDRIPCVAAVREQLPMRIKNAILMSYVKA